MPGGEVVAVGFDGLDVPGVVAAGQRDGRAGVDGHAIDDPADTRVEDREASTGQHLLAGGAGGDLNLEIGGTGRAGRPHDLVPADARGASRAGRTCRAGGALRSGGAGRTRRTLRPRRSVLTE